MGKKIQNKRHEIIALTITNKTHNEANKKEKYQNKIRKKYYSPHISYVPSINYTNTSFPFLSLTITIWHIPSVLICISHDITRNH